MHAPQRPVRLVATMIGATAIGWLAHSVAAAPEPLVHATQPPIVYVISYTDRYFTDPDYIERFVEHPPDLLHVGKAVPITHHWGPVRLLRGENQYTGGPGHTLNWENIALLSPEALAKRIETIRQTLRRYHEIGIPEIIPYISYHTLAGDHQKRQGFWRFYDQWDTHARWAGPRPPHDPFDWLVVDKKGKFVGGSCGGYSPDYYAPLHRYRACIHHPDWAEWHRRLIRMIADVGYDGCFVDNVHPDDCYCRYCKAAFRAFLQENRSLGWVRRLTRGLPIETLTLDGPDTPKELIRRARMTWTRDHLAMLRQVGRQVRKDFTIFANGNSTSQCQLTGAGCDRLMFESTYSSGVMTTRALAGVDELAIDVGAKPVTAKPCTFRKDFGDPVNWVEMEAQVSVPRKGQVGRPVVVRFRITQLGASQRDNDYAEGFCVLLRDAASGREIRVPLTPDIVVGGPGPKGKGKRPPVTLEATWTPEEPGRYVPILGCSYSDSSHIREHPHRSPLTPSRQCRTHIGTLLFAQHMAARPIFLNYESRKKGREAVAELGLAEMAAFSGGGGYASLGSPQAKYRAFFKAHPQLFEGWRPTAPAAVVFARWGGNPLPHTRPYHQRTIHDALAASQRPFVPLLDFTLPEDARGLKGFKVVYFETGACDLTPGQIETLKEYVRRGGHLVAHGKGVRVNGAPFVDVFPPSGDPSTTSENAGRIALWGPDRSMALTPSVLPAEGIGRNLRVATYRQNDRMAVHVVNYNVCLLDEERSVMDVSDVSLRVPLPRGWHGARVTLYAPDAEPRACECKVRQGSLRFVLPKIHIYKIAVLEKR